MKRQKKNTKIKKVINSSKIKELSKTFVQNADCTKNQNALTIGPRVNKSDEKISNVQAPITNGTVLNMVAANSIISNEENSVVETSTTAVSISSQITNPIDCDSTQKSISTTRVPDYQNTESPIHNSRMGDESSSNSKTTDLLNTNSLIGNTQQIVVSSNGTVSDNKNVNKPKSNEKLSIKNKNIDKKQSKSSRSSKYKKIIKSLEKKLAESKNEIEKYKLALAAQREVTKSWQNTSLGIQKQVLEKLDEYASKEINPFASIVKGEASVGYIRTRDNTIHCRNDVYIELQTYHNAKAKISCKDDYKKFVKDMAMAIVGANDLKTSSVTGRKCNRKKDSIAKPPINPTKLGAIYGIFEYFLANHESLDPVAIGLEMKHVGAYISAKICELNRVKKPKNYNSLKKNHVAKPSCSDIDNKVENNVSSQDEDSCNEENGNKKEKDVENSEFGNTNEEKNENENEEDYEISENESEISDDSESEDDDKEGKDSNENSSE